MESGFTFHLELVEVQWVADGDVGVDDARCRLRLDRGQESAVRDGVLDEADALKPESMGSITRGGESSTSYNRTALTHYLS